MKPLKTFMTAVVILLTTLILSPTMSPVGVTPVGTTDDAQEKSDFKALLPFITTWTRAAREPVAIPVYEYTIRVHLAHFEYGTCRDILDDPPLDAQTRIEVYRLETNQIVAEGYGQVEHRLREDEVLGFGFHTYPRVPRKLCPNFFRHEEKWANINGVYEIIDVYVYNPRKPDQQASTRDPRRQDRSHPQIKPEFERTPHVFRDH